MESHPLAYLDWVVAVQSLSHFWLFATPWTEARQPPVSTISWSLFKLMSIELVILSNHFILCCPLLPLSSVFPSITVFSEELALCIRWPKYWSFSIISSNEYSGLVSFRIDWFYLLAVHKTLKSLLQHHIKKNIYFDWMIITLQYCDVFCYTSKWMNQGYCSSIMIWKHQLLFGTQPSIWFSSHICTWLWKNHSFGYAYLCQQSDVSAF